MLSVDFERPILAIKRLQTYASHRTATGIDVGKVRALLCLYNSILYME